ncbi:MAG: nuclear transport factor 2 family protein [Myxococcales bacterium]|nr:MAG: nuclear transport factor 2 family protein [Myxococcales bacterium]
MKSHELVERYLDAWNLTDETHRRLALANLCTENCQYTDPLADVSGPGGLDTVIAGAQRQLPGFRFSLAGSVDAHHDQARFTWHAAPAGASEPVVVGTDVVVFENGRIRSVLGFLDKVPG